jgi:electron-transferring-flavoprotein dehydrogenase
MEREAEGGREVSVCVIEKGSEVGAHILSGAVIEPRALDELIPDWKERGAPLNAPVTEEKFMFLTGGGRSFAVPVWLMPGQLHNHGNYIVSLGNVCRWLAGLAGSRASRPAIWAWPRTAPGRTATSRAWSCAPSTPSSRRAAVVPCPRP